MLNVTQGNGKWCSCDTNVLCTTMLIDWERLNVTCDNSISRRCRARGRGGREQASVKSPPKLEDEWTERGKCNVAGVFDKEQASVSASSRYTPPLTPGTSTLFCHWFPLLWLEYQRVICVMWRLDIDAHGCLLSEVPITLYIPLTSLSVNPSSLFCDDLYLCNECGPVQHWWAGIHEF